MSVYVKIGTLIKVIKSWFAFKSSGADKKQTRIIQKIGETR